MNHKILNNYYTLAKKHIEFQDDKNLIDGHDHIDAFQTLLELMIQEMEFPHTNDLTLRKTFRDHLIKLLKDFDPSKEIDWAKVKNQILTKLVNSPRNYIIGFGIPLKTKRKGKFPFSRLTVDNLKYCSINWNTYKNEFGFSEMFNHFQKRHSRERIASALNKFKFYKAYVKATSDRHAIDTFDTNFSLLKASINTANYWLSYTRHLGSGIKMHSAIIDPEIYIVTNSTTPKIDYYTYYPKYILIPECSLERDIKQISLYNKIIRILKKPNDSRNDIESILLNCIKAYDLALSSTTRQEAFLHYWRILEYATGTGDRNNKEIVKLLIPFFKREENKLKAKLLVKIRNNLVHKGEFYEYSDFHLNWIKEYAEASIQILFWLLKKGYSTRSDLETFYSIYTNSKEIKKLKVKILNHLQK